MSLLLKLPLPEVDCVLLNCTIGTLLTYNSLDKLFYLFNAYDDCGGGGEDDDVGELLILLLLLTLSFLDVIDRSSKTLTGSARSCVDPFMTCIKYFVMTN